MPPRETGTPKPDIAKTLLPGLNSPKLEPRPVQRRHHRLPVRPAPLPSRAALPEVLRGRCPVLARPAAIAAGPEREAHIVAVGVGAVPVVGPPAAVAVGPTSGGGGGGDASAPVRSIRRTSRGRSGSRGDNHSRVARASDLGGSTALLGCVARLFRYDSRGLVASRETTKSGIVGKQWGGATCRSLRYPPVPGLGHNDFTTRTAIGLLTCVR